MILRLMKKVSILFFSTCSAEFSAYDLSWVFQLKAKLTFPFTKKPLKYKFTFWFTSLFLVNSDGKPFRINIALLGDLNNLICSFSPNCSARIKYPLPVRGQ